MTVDVLIGQETIQQRVRELAVRIVEDYGEDNEILLVGILKGAFIFLADLARELTLPSRIVFLALSSYENGDRFSGQFRLSMDMRDNIKGKHVLLIDDILDTGRTLHHLQGLIEAREPASIRTCVLVQKQCRKAQNISADYVGFEVSDVWVVGYGLDYDEKYRNLPYIGDLEPSIESALSPA